MKKGILVISKKSGRVETNSIDWQYANGFQLKSNLICRLIEFLDDRNSDSFQIFKNPKL